MDILTTEQLENMGLDSNKAKVYMALLEIGKGSVTEISTKAKINRTTGYDILERLCLDGLAGRSKINKKKIYISESPNKLKQYLKNKERQARQRLSELDNILPNLESLYKTDLKPVIKFADGKEEMINMYLHKLEAKSTIYSILNLKGYSEDFDEMGKYSSKERYKKGIKEKVLALKNEVALEWWSENYKKDKKRQQNTQYRWLEPTMKQYPNGEINIFDDKIIIMLTKPGEYMAFEIISQSLSAFLKIMFELAWDATGTNK